MSHKSAADHLKSHCQFGFTLQAAKKALKFIYIWHVVSLQVARQCVCAIVSVGLFASATVSAPVSARASASASARGSATASASASIASSITWRRRDLQTPPCHAQRVLMIYDLGQGRVHMELKVGGWVGRLHASVAKYETQSFN